jgi:arsenate reductase-like glutaredoxin family protein
VSGGAVVQVFGRNDSQATRRALRFFKERRMAVSFVDVTKRAPAAGELRRFSQPHGARALLDEEGRAYREAGLAYLRLTDDEILERLVADPRLLRLPLVRHGPEVTIGVDEESWRRWHSRPVGTASSGAQ